MNNMCVMCVMQGQAGPSGSSGDKGPQGEPVSIHRKTLSSDNVSLM